jgi:hypothetical protein
MTETGGGADDLAVVVLVKLLEAAVQAHSAHPSRGRRNAEITQYTPLGSHQVWSQGNDVVEPVKVTKLQQAAYDAQLAAGLPVSELAGAVLILSDGSISHRHCATYILAVQETDWFKAAFPSHVASLAIRGGRGGSNADALRRQIKIGTNNRFGVGECEQACLHELAHIVSPDYAPGKELREPRIGRDSSKGHHHAWRVNFVLIVSNILGKQAARQLRHEFNQWGLPTSK